MSTAFWREYGRLANSIVDGTKEMRERIADLERRNAAHLRTIDGLNATISLWERAVKERKEYHHAADIMSHAEKEAMRSIYWIENRVFQLLAEREKREAKP